MRFAQPVLLAALAAGAVAAAPARFSSLPLVFEPNRGQSDQRVQFLARVNGYMLFVDRNSLVMALPGDETLRLNLPGAARNWHVEGVDRLPGASNYFHGNDPAKWRTNVPHYGKVRVREVYPGIDLVFYGNQRRLEYDFIVSPGADPRAIRIAYDGAKNTRIDSSGDLILSMAGGELRQHRPRIYQVIDGRRRDVAGGYELIDGQVRVAVARYDAGRPLVIDPILSYADFLGGDGTDFGYGVAVDTAGNTYVTGRTNSTNYPAVGAISGQATPKGDFDGFVTKVNATGTAIAYSTYLGGEAFDQAVGIAVDSTGAAYITGTTNSGFFPEVGGLPPFSGGTQDAFVAKLSPSGSSLVYSTYLGGTTFDGAYGIAVDSTGAAYIAGYSGFDSVFPGTVTTFGPRAFTDTWVAKLNPAGNTRVYLTFLGGRDVEFPFAIAVDSQNRAYVTGYTNSSDFPTRNAMQAVYAGGDGTYGDAFITRLTAAGNDLEYSTFLGGTRGEAGRAIAVDSSFNVYVAGLTTTRHDALVPFPLTNPFQSTFKGGTFEAFLTKLNSSGSARLYSTYLGGSKDDIAWSLAVDSSGNAYVGGNTTSTDFPTANALQLNIAGGADTFVVKLDPNGSFNQPTPLFSTYFGGPQDDWVFGIAIDPNRNVYISGTASSPANPATYFPSAVTPPFRSYGGGPYDAFVAKLGNANLRLSSVSSTLSTSKASGGFERNAAGNITFVQQVTNQAGSDSGADNVEVKGNLPSTLTLISCVANGQNCAAGGNQIGGPIGGLPVGSSTNVTITASLNDNVAPGTVISFALRVRSETNDLDENDNTSMATFTVPSTCTFSLSKISASVSASGDLGRVDIVTPAGCAWSASSTASWVAVAPASGQGAAAVRFTVAPNTTASLRFTDLAIAGQAFTVIQPANGCLFTLTVGATTVPADGAPDTLGVSSTPGCSWTASSGASWIAFSGGLTGVGNGSAAYNVSANSKAFPRSGALSVGGQTIHLIQNATLAPQLFTDVPSSHPYFNQVTLMKQNNITSGCTATAYCPDATTTRSQMAVFIVRALMGGDNFTYQQAPFFTDVPATHDHFKWVQKMRELGITTGCTATAYCPGDAVTRGQMAVFIVRAALGITASDPFSYPAVARFTDVQTSHPYFTYIQKMAERGITTGCTATAYCADATTTRGQMAVFIIRALLTP